MKHPRNQGSSAKRHRLSPSIIKIQYGALRPPNIETIPTEVQQVIEDAVEGNHRPEDLIERTKELIARFPKIAVLHNTHYSQLNLADRTEEALAKADLCFKSFKSYVLGRLVYAHLLLEAGYYEKMEEVMEYFTSSLQEWYPKRTEFQYKEVTLYLYLQGVYYCRRGDTKNIDGIVSILKKLKLDEDDKMISFFIIKIAAMKLKFARNPILSSQSDTTDG